VTYLLPPSALLWGFLILHERPQPTSFVALALILSGVFMITVRRAPVAVRVGVDEAVGEA
jgi:drug/metabolite transporter (DMT)-like permease